MDTTILTSTYLKTQIERVTNLRNKISSRDAIVSDGRTIPEDGDLSIGAGRRLEATIMFLDICKFSLRPSETLEEQESMLRVLSFFFSEMIRIVEDYGGIVEKNTGDGLMAYFIRDTATNTSAQQIALASALSMFFAADNLLNPALRDSSLQPIDFRICMDHGQVTIADVGAARRFRGIVAIGTTANVASKMLAVADPNTILLGDAVLSGLPLDWTSTHTSVKTANTGWVYRATNAPYPFHTFTGRWKVPKL